MGNRAVITLKNHKPDDLGVYLHWCGCRDTVEAFLLYCELKGYRSPDTDCFGFARLCQTIGNYFNNGLSVGVDRCCRLDCNNGDNGVYEIEDWKIVGRKFASSDHLSGYDFLKFMRDINSAQPKQIQLTDDELVAAVERRNHHEP